MIDSAANCRFADTNGHLSAANVSKNLKLLIASISFYQTAE